jgi:hypothetical protein
MVTIPEKSTPPVDNLCISRDYSTMGLRPGIVSRGTALRIFHPVVFHVKHGLIVEAADPAASLFCPACFFSALVVSSCFA